MFKEHPWLVGQGYDEDPVPWQTHWVAKWLAEIVFFREGLC